MQEISTQWERECWNIALCRRLIVQRYLLTLIYYEKELLVTCHNNKSLFLNRKLLNGYSILKNQFVYWWFLIPSFFSNTKLPKGCSNDNLKILTQNFHRHTLILSNSSVAPESQEKSRPLSSNERSQSVVSLVKRIHITVPLSCGSIPSSCSIVAVFIFIFYIFIIIIMLLKKRISRIKHSFNDINDNHTVKGF